MHIDRRTLRNVFLGVGGCILLYWLLHETERVRNVYLFLKNIFSPFIIGAGLAFVLNVPMRGIEDMLQSVKKRALRRTIAVVVTFICIGLVLFLVVRLLLPQMTETVQNLIARLPAFFNTVLDKVKELLNDNPQLMEWVRANTELENINWSSLVEKIVTYAGTGVTALLGSAFSAIGSLSSGIFNAVISLVFGLYCLFRKEILARQARRLAYAFLPEKICDESIRILRMTNATFSNFISGQCLEAIILGCLFALAMLIFRMPYIPLVSVLVAVTALVPIVGAFVGCFLGAFFILVDNPIQAVWFVVMFLVIQQFENNVIYPKVVGKSVGLPGMWVLLAVTVGGELMGVAGMLLMIPLVSVVYTLLREITNARLEKRGIARIKLQDHPPELRSKLQQTREMAKNRKKNDKQSDEEPSDNETSQ
jgi:predicted PurR-regulated permease PerM